MSSDHPVPGASELTTQPIPGRSATRSFRLATAVIWTVAILVLCWIPKEFVLEVEDESPWFRLPRLDKVVHCGIFLVFSILWLRLRPGPRISDLASPGPHPASRSSSRPAIWMVVLGGFALGALSELGQLVPLVRRDASLYDLVTDCAGVLIGIAIAPRVEPWIRSLERRLFCEPPPALIPAEPAAPK